MKLVADLGGSSARFASEIHLLAALDHPAIVRYVAHGKAEGAPFLAMEWLDGEDLSQRLLREPLSLRAALELVRRTAEALGEAHDNGVIHRDIKPSNLFLVDGDRTRLKLIDFGVARMSEANLDMTKTGAVIGTAGYIAPEQARGSKTIDGRADIFSLGCVLYECLAGRPAFEGNHPMALLAKLLLEDPPPVRTLRPDAAAQQRAPGLDAR